MTTPRRSPIGWSAAGIQRPARLATVLAEDFSLLIRNPRKFRPLRGTHPSRCPTVLN